MCQTDSTGFRQFLRVNVREGGGRVRGRAPAQGNGGLAACQIECPLALAAPKELTLRWEDVKKRVMAAREDLAPMQAHVAVEIKAEAETFTTQAAADFRAAPVSTCAMLPSIVYPQRSTSCIALDAEYLNTA